MYSFCLFRHSTCVYTTLRWHNILLTSVTWWNTERNALPATPRSDYVCLLLPPLPRHATPDTLSAAQVLRCVTFICNWLRISLELAEWFVDHMKSLQRDAGAEEGGSRQKEVGKGMHCGGWGCPLEEAAAAAAGTAANQSAPIELDTWYKRERERDGGTSAHRKLPKQRK